jgi:hypothetical protein
MDDCRSLKASNMVSFTPDALSPNFGGEAGGNIIYVYGDFPYAATSEYEQDGLVAHFDGINNLGLGDKQHDFNTTNWKDLKNAFYLHKGGYAEGQWLSNGFQSRNDSTSFTYTGNFPAAYPTGNHGRTVEVIFRTPVAANMFVQETEIQRVIFRYGGNAQTLQFGILYRGLSETISTHEVICLDDPGNPWIFYAIAGNTRNLITCLSSTPSLETPNTINTVTSTYANSIQDEDSTNSYINNLFSPPALREGTILDTPLSGTISIGRYLSGSTFLSVRLYDRVLDRDEIKHNAALDQKRYLTPPTVTIGGNACEEVVVLSPHFLMCKVPAGTLGLQNVTVVSDGVTTTYNGAYRYVDNSAFYINTISPIVGTANQTGQTLTLTGNKLEDIATVEVDGDECTYDSTDSDGAYKYTLPVKVVAGETDIMITLIGGEVYRFAKVFEYK